jgi:hypothetical protein
MGSHPRLSPNGFGIDIDSTQALLTEAEAAYRAKVTALTGAKAKLTRARNDMAHATLVQKLHLIAAR